jgi:hypothetical protein
MSKEKRIRHINQVIEEHGFAEIIFDKDAIFEMLDLLRQAILEMDGNPEKSLVIGVLIDKKVQSSIGPGVVASRVVSVVGTDIVKLRPGIKGYSDLELEDRVDNFMDSFNV